MEGGVVMDAEISGTGDENSSIGWRTSGGSTLDRRRGAERLTDDESEATCFGGGSLINRAVWSSHCVGAALMIEVAEDWIGYSSGSKECCRTGGWLLTGEEDELWSAAVALVHSGGSGADEEEDEPAMLL